MKKALALIVCLLMVAPSFATISVNANRVDGGGSASGSTIISPAASHTTGNVIVVAVSFLSGGSITSMVDTAGNTYIYIPGSQITSAGGSIMSIWYAYNITGNASNVVTVTLDSSRIYRSIAVYELTSSNGAFTSDPFNTASTGSGSGTTSTTGTLTISAAQEMIIEQTVSGSGADYGGGSYTIVNHGITGDATHFFSDGYHVITASEAASATSGSQAWAICAASFKDVTGSGATAAVCSPPFCGIIGGM